MATVFELTLAAVAGFGQEAGKMNSTIARLEIQPSGGEVRAHLKVTNNTHSEIFLEKSKIFIGGEISNNLFHITNERAPVPYKGIMEKLRKPRPEDFLKLGAGQQYEVTVDLATAYRFSRGNPAYAVYYKALHSFPDRDGYWTLESNTVNFNLGL